MASVYTGAVVTIAAAWGSDGTCGCFHDHQPSLRISIEEQRRAGSSLTNKTHHMYLRPQAQGKRYLREAILNTRAWTLQEIILSRRTIFFAEDQMYWYCSSLYESEDGLESVQDVAETSVNLPSLGPVARHGGQSKDLLYESWQVTMKSYSARQLTNGGDKFAALAGVTEFFGALVGDEAVAGLWQGDLGRGLMWQVPPGMHGKIDADVVTRLNAPSWSWIKAKGGVEPSVADTRMCATDLVATVKWDGLPMTSRISHASIRGRAKVLRIVGVHKDTDELCFCVRPRRVTFETGSCEVEDFKVYWRMDECLGELPEDIHFLLMRFNNIDNPRKSDESVTEIAGLIIAATESTGSDFTFRRIGAGDIPAFPLALYERIPLLPFELS